MADDWGKGRVGIGDCELHSQVETKLTATRVNGRINHEACAKSPKEVVQIMRAVSVLSSSRTAGKCATERLPDAAEVQK
jgi:hypothetical protein